MRREISVYTEIYFCIYEKRFPYIRKSPPVRTQKIRRAGSKKSACARGEISVRKKIFFCAHGNFAPCPQKPTHSGRDEGHSSHREQEQVPPKVRRGHGRGEVCRYSWGRAPITFIIFAKYEQQQSISDPLGRRRNRSAQAAYPLPQGEGLRSDARPQRRRRYRSRTDPELRPHLPRREHAGDYGP